MVAVPALNEIETAYLKEAQERPSGEPAWLTARRETGAAAFAAMGFPHRRIEEWKYTDLKAKLGAHFPLAEPSADAPSLEGLSRDPFAALDAHRVYIVDGVYRADMSAPQELADGIYVGDVMQAAACWGEDLLGTLQGTGAVTGLNLARFTGGAALFLQADKAADKPIHIVHVTTQPGRSQHHRVLIKAERGAKAVVLESFVGPEGGARLITSVTEARVAESARIEHVKAQTDGEGAIHVGGVFAAIAPYASFEGFTFTSGGSLTRNEAVLRFEGPEGRGHVSGAYALVDTQHADNTTLIDHAEPDCISREVFAGVLADTARGVFQGKILVRPDAQRTDGYQLNQALLLSSGAEVDSKPELEIYADDVKCSHGATAGELDEDALFYLTSRGIPVDQAKALLIGAFLAGAMEEVAEESVRAALQEHVAHWLTRHADRVHEAVAGATHDRPETD